MDTQPYRRRRPALSCIECRRRKVKCDRKDPCTPCTTVKARCTYKSNGRERINQHYPQNASTRGSTLSNITSRWHPLAENHRPLADGTTPTSGNFPAENLDITPLIPGNHIPNVANHHQATTLINNGDVRTDFGDLSQRVQRLEKSALFRNDHTPTGSGQSLLSLQSKLQDSQIGETKARVLRWSQWQGKDQKFATVLLCFNQYSNYNKKSTFENPEVGALAAQIYDLLQRCKMLARRLKVARPSRSLSGPESRLRPPSRQIANTMVDLYFGAFESVQRILHVPTFWAEYDKYWAQPENSPINLNLKVLLVVAIGSALKEPEDLDYGFRELVQQWVYTAQMWLSGPLEKDRLDITGLQIYCLTILARQVFSIGGDLVWISVGSLIHRAMQMGLHRDPKHLPKMSVLQAEVRRRLWATILEMAAQASLDSGMPPRISQDEHDVEMPANINDDEIYETTLAIQPHSKDIYTSTSMQLMLSESLPMRLRVAQLLNGLNHELPYLDVLALSSEISNACQLCYEFTKKHEKSGLTAFHRNMLDYTIRRFLLPLHFPFATEASTNSLFSHSLKISVNTALAIMSPEPDNAYSNLMATGGGMFKDGIRNVSNAISVELLSVVETQRLDGSLHRSSQYRDSLKKAISDLISLFLVRFQRGETNVKGHMLLSMIKAQVEAMEERTNVELKIAQSAKGSLEICCDLLNQRLNSTSLPYLDDAGFATMIPDDGQGSSGFDLDLDSFLSDAGFL